MENKLMIFENEAFGKVRTLNLNGEPWFVAADVCKALELGNPSMTVERLDDDEKGISTIDTLGGKQRMAIINEPGLYSLVITSRKPEAKAFKRWITHEVIPAIRKHGVYITDEKLKLFAEHPELLDALMKSLYATHAENLRHRAERQTLLPKADYYDAFMDADGCTNLRTTATCRSAGLPAFSSRPAFSTAALRGTSCPTPFPATAGCSVCGITSATVTAARTPSSPPWARACSGSCSAAARPFPTD